MAGAEESRAVALVRAIRRAHGCAERYGGLEGFTVTDIHDFARRLVDEGVRAFEAVAGSEPPG